MCTTASETKAPQFLSLKQILEHRPRQISASAGRESVLSSEAWKHSGNAKYFLPLLGDMATGNKPKTQPRTRAVVPELP